MTKKSKKQIGQLGLFSGAVKPQNTPEKNFAENLYKAKLISAGVKRKNPNIKPRTINVKQRVAEAAAILQNARGVNLKELQEILKSKEKQTLRPILESGVVKGIKRSPEEQRKMKAALNVIIYFTNRNKDRKVDAKKHAPAVRTIVENATQKKHMRDIAKEYPLK